MSSFSAFLFILTVAIVQHVHGAPSAAGTNNNDTVVLPHGTSNHGDPNLICEPAKWTDLAIFFIGNYVAHAATVVLEPGPSALENAVIVISAFLLPGSGLFRALRAIATGAIFARDDLRTAARARALCTFLKIPDEKQLLEREWQKSGNFIHRKVSTKAERKIHGTFDMPQDHILIILPPDAKFAPQPPGCKLKLCSNYNALKVIIALGQALYAISTLYQTRGDQIARFGYAAFGLTVVPYLFMSLMNLVGNLLRPDYPTLYLVQSSDMKAAAEAGATVSGVVAELTPGYEAQLKGAAPTSAVPDQSASFYTFGTLALVLGVVVPVGIIGGMTHFHQGSSTRAERVWVMVWIVIGALFGGLMGGVTVAQMEDDDPEAHGSDGHFIHLIIALFFCAPAIGGFVVVAQEIGKYGICQSL